MSSVILVQLPDEQMSTVMVMVVAQMHTHRHTVSRTLPTEHTHIWGTVSVWQAYGRLHFLQQRVARITAQLWPLISGAGSVSLTTVALMMLMLLLWFSTAVVPLRRPLNQVTAVDAFYSLLGNIF